MYAGKMRSSIEILSPEATKNAFGEKSVQWISQGRWHAQRQSLTGRQSEEVGELFPTYTARFIINSAHTPRENWRLRHDGYLYEIQAIEPNMQRGFKTLICKRVNE